MSKEQCNKHLYKTGLPAPRTCSECGLGACKHERIKTPKKRELKDLSKDDYSKLLAMGFLYEFHFEATGNWWNDCGQYQEASNPTLQTKNTWRPIISAPRNRYILLAGDSGYITTPLRAEIGKWSHDREAWMNHGGDYFTDGGSAPIYWAELLEIPVK